MQDSNTTQVAWKRLAIMLQYQFEMNLLEFVREVKTELTKVTWPRRDAVTRLTAIVVAISVIIGGYIGGLDYLFTKLTELIISN